MKTLVLPQVHFLNSWQTLQIGYEKIVRWKDYLKENPNLRRQTNLEHIVSVSFLFDYFLNFGSLAQFFDRELVRLAIQVHEIGEIDHGDTLYHNKKKDGHIAELKSFLSFLDSMPELGTVNRKRFIESFLLQFATDSSIDFILFGLDTNIQDIFEDLKDSRGFEAKVFNALERYDYFLYAFESFQVCKDVVILTHVLRNQKHHLDRYVDEISQFNKFWTPEIQDFSVEFLKIHKSIPGPKDDGGIPAAYRFARVNEMM